MSCPICDQWCKMYLRTTKIKVSVVTEKRNEVIHLLLLTKMDKNDARKIQGGVKPSKLMFSCLKHHLLMLIRSGNRSHKCKRYLFKNWRLKFNLTGNHEI